MPDVASSASAPYAWLAFQGRWGQKERGTNNGPTGRGAEERWTAPIEWSRGLRQTSIEVPGGTAFGLSIGNFFRGAVRQGAVTVNWSLSHPVPFMALLPLAMVEMLAAVTSTTWRPPDLHPVRRRRDGGQIFRAARRVNAENIPIFAAAGAIFVPLRSQPGNS